MRKITPCKLKCHRKPGPRDAWYEHDVHTMQPGTAWRYDQYGQHEVVEVTEAICKKSEGWRVQHFDGRTMILFDADGKQYLQPLEDDPRAKDDRLGKKRKIHKRKAQSPRHEAPGVAPPAAGAPEPVRRAARPEPSGEPRAKGLLRRPLSLD